MSRQLLSTSQRITSVDAFRGFALAGIVLVHILEEYVGGPVPPDVKNIEPGILDGIIDGIAFILIRGKFFALFSILFGLSFFIQMDRASQRQEPYALRFVWRLIILGAIGYLHSLFYQGDILTIYALLGFLLVPFHKLSNSVILTVAGILFLGVGRFVLFGLNGTDPLFSDTNPLDDQAGILAYYETLKSGSLLEVFRLNAVDGHLRKMEFQFNYFGRGYLTLACFLVGFWLGRIRFFDQLANDRKFLKRTFFYSLGATLLLMGLMAALFASSGSDGPQGMNTWLSMAALSAYDLWNMGLTAVILVGFLWIYQSRKGERRLNGLAPYGRMALTNYVIQSIIGTYLLFGWGVGLIGELHQWALALIAIGVVIIQIYWSKWWLDRFRYGPLEWAWRSLTYGKVQSFRKQVLK